MSTSSRPNRFSRSVGLRSLLPQAVFVGAEDIAVRTCCNSAAHCKPGDVFVPASSGAIDQHELVDEAIRRGAVAVVAERLLPVSVPQCLVEDTQRTYGQICQALVGHPSQRLLTIGIVGTYGKTTTSLFVAAMLKRQCGSVAYYTSLGCSDSEVCDRTSTRAPAARKLAQWMQKADRAGAPAAVLEMTPAMLHQKVAAGVEFDLLIVTGARPGQFRGSPSGRQFLELVDQATAQLKPHGIVLYNADDASAAAWAANSKCVSMSYGIDAAEHIRAKRLSRFGGEQQLLAIAGNILMPLTLKIPGDHVARAAMAAVATSYLLELPIPEAIAGIESLQTIPGRMQRLQQAVEVPLFVDAAETPDRIAVALHALRQHQFGPATAVVQLHNGLAPSLLSRLGEVLDKAAAKIVLTSSDLSAEATQRMAMDVLGGVRSPGRVQVIPDREAAIHWAVRNTDSGCILLGGCGAAPWLDREGKEVCDEAVAKRAVTERNVLVLSPQLAIFPPPSSSQQLTR
jgi:UDP-N-acetylmuramoyl-L-alanyl-D-glutamate--2,6-diaminopimelate ligase